MDLESAFGVDDFASFRDDHRAGIEELVQTQQCAGLGRVDLVDDQWDSVLSSQSTGTVFDDGVTTNNRTRIQQVGRLHISPHRNLNARDALNGKPLADVCGLTGAAIPTDQQPSTRLRVITRPPRAKAIENRRSNSMLSK